MNPVLCRVQSPEASCTAGAATMRIVNIMGVTTVVLLVMTQYAMSQRGGAARSGVRGAAVGQMVGGTEGAEKGAKIGVVTGATRTAMDRETTARTQYQATPAYQS